jgi:hypothetical protein
MFFKKKTIIIKDDNNNNKELKFNSLKKKSLKNILSFSRIKLGLIIKLTNNGSDAKLKNSNKK